MGSRNNAILRRLKQTGSDTHAGGDCAFVWLAASTCERDEIVTLIVGE